MTARKWGSETVVNTTKSGNQRTPDVATLADGQGYVIAWLDDGVEPARLKFQMYNADGTPRGPELSGPEPTFSSPELYDLSNPNLMALPDGGFVLAYDVDVNSTTSLAGVEAQVYNASGAPVGTPFQVDEQLDVSTSIDGAVATANELLFTWYDATNRDIQIESVDLTGATASFAEFRANSAAGASIKQSEPSIARLTNGNIAVVWEDDTGLDSVRGKVFGSDGTTSTSELTIATVNTGQAVPKITALASGGFVVTYSDNNPGFPDSGFGVRAKIFGPDGVQFGPEIIVNTSLSGNQLNADVAALPDGGFFIAWADQNGSDTVRGQAFNALGERVGRESIVTTNVFRDGGTNSVSVTALEDGRVMVAYENDLSSADGSGSAIVSQIVDPRGGVVYGDANANKLYGNFSDDEITGFSGNDELFGLLGNDYLYGGEADDILNGGIGTDALFGGNGSDTASYALASSGVTARLDTQANFGEAAGDFYSSIENLTGTNFVDFLVGNGEANILNGGAGNDTLFAEGGDDIIIGGAGADIINGGQGTDIASYITATAGVTARLDGLENLNTGDAAGDTYGDIQGLTGTDFNDLLVGNGFANTLDGGKEGDFLFGFGGDDILIGGEGADALNGGDGRDTASYETSRSNVAARLDGQPGFGDAAGDSFVSIEDLTGSRFADFLVGDGLANIIRGGGDNDTIFGQGGNDLLFGSGGNDILNGGAGSDIFYYDSFSDSSGHPQDTIQDFDATDANEVLFFAGLLVGNFTFLGSSANNFTGGNDNSEAKFNDASKVLEIDFDGDANTDMFIELTGVSLANLDASDFMFG